ncbi:hypothetical protein GCM10007898_25870 [Dyella flagellata]|uniref:Uncharacterized protein n=1 Tax=Dyella flagellata TaxID=1867833 RepID=A0ABQ5XBL4_9GAMM|nr:hypothetical protein GCM10007898_25870 [Dyella flagellata]
MARVIGLGNDPLLDKLSKSVGKDIGCDTLQGLGQEFAEMPSIHEDDVADDEQGPLIAKHFERLVDDAFGSRTRAHAASNSDGRSNTILRQHN